MDCISCNKSFRILPDTASSSEPYLVKEEPLAPKDEEIEVRKESGKRKRNKLVKNEEEEFFEDTGPRYTNRKKDFFSGEGVALDNILGLIAVFLGCFTLMAASFPLIDHLVIPLGLTTIGLAIYAALLDGNAVKRFTFPLLALLICSPTLYIIINSPEWFRELRTKPVSKSIKDKFVWVAPGERPFQPEKSDEPINAAQYGIQRNDVRVVVSLVRYSKVEYTQSKTKKLTKDPKIQIMLKVFNAGYEKPFEFSSWQSFGNEVKLYDSKGEELTLWKRPMGASELTIPSKTVFSGKTIEETLIFDAPFEKFDELKLELPVKAFGEVEPEELLDAEGKPKPKPKIMFILPLKLISG